MVADISAQNANVAYELGLMQSLGRQCAILFSNRTRKGKQSDLKGIEDVRYSNGKELKTRLANWIQDNVKEADRISLKKFIKGS
jgi:predicted nucleotide-binding protein